MEGEKRCRYRGGVGRLVEIVAPFAIEPGWFMYAECGKDPVQKNLLLKHKVFLRALYELTPRLTFIQSDMEKCMKTILEGRSDWPLRGEERKEQPRIVANIVRAACRHCAQALRKRSPPKRVKAIFFEDKGHDFAPKVEEKADNDQESEPERDSEDDQGAESPKKKAPDNCLNADLDIELASEPPSEQLVSEFSPSFMSDPPDAGLLVEAEMAL